MKLIHDGKIRSNKADRHYRILGSAITFFLGLIAAAIAIFFGFAQLQTPGFRPLFLLSARQL